MSNGDRNANDLTVVVDVHDGNLAVNLITLPIAQPDASSTAAHPNGLGGCVIAGCWTELLTQLWNPLDGKHT